MAQTADGWTSLSRCANASRLLPNSNGKTFGSGNSCNLVPVNSYRGSHASSPMPPPIPPLPLFWLTCFSQKQAVELLSSPSRPK